MSLLLLFNQPAGAPAPSGGPERKRRSTARKKRKPGVVYLPGTEPQKIPPEPVVVPVTGVRIVAREIGSDQASIHLAAVFLPAIAMMLAREAPDMGRISVNVMGIGYDEDDLEVLALAMGAD